MARHQPAGKSLSGELRALIGVEDLRPAWFRFSRDQGINAAPLERAVDLSVGIAREGGDHLDVDARNRFNLIDLRLDHLPIVRLSSRDRDIQNDTDLVIDGPVLLVSGFQPPLSCIRAHCRIGISRADLLILAALPALSLSLAFILALLSTSTTCCSVRPSQLTLARISDASSADHLRGGDLGLQTGLDRAFEDPTEPLFAPALADARQA